MSIDIAGKTPVNICSAISLFLEDNFLKVVLNTAFNILRDDCGLAVGAVSTITTLSSLLFKKTSAALFLFKIRGHASKQLHI